MLIKLNGGLGTSMGMDRAKSLLPVRDGRTFLDLIVEQVRHARASLRRAAAADPHGLASAPGTTPWRRWPRTRTSPSTGLPLDFLQNQEPKLLADGPDARCRGPRTRPWSGARPGHGDIYTAILASGVLDALLEQGFRYANTSNADNLGAAPEPGPGRLVRRLRRPVRRRAVPAHRRGPQGRPPRRSASPTAG